MAQVEMKWYSLILAVVGLHRTFEAIYLGKEKPPMIDLPTGGRDTMIDCGVAVKFIDSAGYGPH